jgi:CheY-like chemotaxis protein
VTHTLLLADDSVTIQRVIELTFADEDVQVIAVSDGDQAIERLEASPPDIVLADIGMPGRNGYEVAKYIKQSPRLAHIPVVLLTGAFEPVDQARASEAGCDGVLAKPFEPQLVISRVKDLLAKQRQADHVSPVRSPETVADAAPPEIVAPAVLPPAPAAVQPLDYFDRLDAAFSKFSNEPAPEPPKTPEPPAASPLAVDIDWFGAAKTETRAPAPEWDVPQPPAAVEPPDLPLSFLAPEPHEPHEAPVALEALAVPFAAASSEAVAQHEPVVEAPPVDEPVAAAEPPAVEEAPVAPEFAAWLAASSESAPVAHVAAPTVSPFEVAATAHPVAPIEGAAPVEDVAPVEDAVTVDNAVAVEELTPVEDAAPVEDVTPVEHTAPHEDAPVVAALVAVPEASPQPIAVSDMAEAAPSPQWAAPPEPVAEAAPVVTPALVAPPTPAVHALPSLADAFAALLAAEKEEGRPASAPTWPASAPSSSLAHDQVVEQVTRRVLDHLSDRVVRETVAELVSSIAERLVREEIERIKAAIQ